MRNTRTEELISRFPDFGTMRGKSEKENPLINRQLQHMELDLWRGVTFLIFLFRSFSSLVMWQAGTEMQKKHDVN